MERATNISDTKRIPHNIYMQIQYKLRDYDRLRQLRDELLYASAPPPDGIPRSKSLSDPTGTCAVRLALVNAQLHAIESSAYEVAKRYASKAHSGFEPIEAYHNYDYFCTMFLTGRDSAPSRRTWNYYKAALSQKIAEKLYLI